MTEMKAAIARAHGGPEALRIETMPRPAPAPGQVLIRIAACGVNFADTLLLKGTYQATPPLPLTPGMEIAGTIEAVGADAGALRPGMRVAACGGHGGFAEYALAPAAACAVLPDALSERAAAAVMVGYGTADLALHHRARLQPGQTLAVLGAGGGVGLTGVALGRLMGARVIGVARGAGKQALAREHGADTVLEADPETLRDALLSATQGRGVDVLYDPVGGALFDQSLRAMAFEGRAIPIGFAGGTVPLIKANHLLVKNITVIGLWWTAYFERAPAIMAASLTRIFDWAASGALAPPSITAMPLARAAEALSMLAERRVAGKIVIEP